jgi:hypothetical protein
MAVTAREPGVSTTVIGSDPAHEPRLGWRAIGAMAATTLASGPVLMLSFALLNTMRNPDSPVFNIVNDPADVALTLAKSVIRGPIVSLPATLIHAVTIGVLAHHARDAFGWSLASATALGVTVGVLFVWVLLLSGEIAGFDLLSLAGLAAPFATTGAMMGLLYWRIAIRPQRQWRLLRQHGQDAVRTME